MKTIISCLTALLLVPVGACAMEPSPLKTEFLENPPALDTAKPRFSWIVEDTTAGAKQSAYQVQAASSPEKLAKGEADLWDSGKVTSDQSHLVEYAGKALVSRQPVCWRVKTWDKDGKETGWSPAGSFSIGLLAEEDWKAQWIKTPLKPENNEAAQLWVRMATVPMVPINLTFPGPKPPALPSPEEAAAMEKRNPAVLETLSPCPLLRKELVAKAAIRKARAWVAAPGFFELHINGKKVGDRDLEPGIMPFRKQILYSVHDITPYLQPGSNALGLILGHGWFDSSGISHCIPTGNDPVVRAEFEIEYENGSREVILTDGSWKFAAGPILKDSHWLGECYDAQKEIAGWDQAGFDDSGWKNGVPTPSPTKSLAPDLVPPERAVRRIPAKKLYSPLEGVWIYDMGEAFSGVAELKVNVPAGTKLTMRYAQRLWAEDQQIGSLLHYEHLESKERIPGLIAPSYGTMGVGGGFPSGWSFQAVTPADVYVAKGGGEETWRRRFGYNGYRYVELTGYPGQPPEDAVTGVVVHTDLPREGSFSCGNELLNQIHEAAMRSYLYCTHGFTQDNPTREKQFTAGMVAGYARAASTLFPQQPLWRKLVDASVLTQDETGHLDAFFNFREYYECIVSESGAIELAYLLWKYQGDDRPLRRSLDAFAAYFDYYFDNPQNRRAKSLSLWPQCEKAAEDLSKGDLRGGNFSFDWYDGCTVRDLPRGQVNLPPTPKLKLMWGTGYSLDNLRMFIEMARHADRQDLVEKYQAMAKRLREALNKEFYDPAKNTYGSQNNDALALSAGLPPEEERQKVAASIASDIERMGGRFVAGTQGFPRIFDALSAHGYEDTAYTIATRKGYPGLANLLEPGYGTFLETWDTYKHPHGAVGGVIQSERGRMAFWFAEWLCGIRPDPQHPGFQHFLLGPVFPKDLAWAKAEVPSPYGKISSAWKREQDGIHWRVTVPWNTTATVKLPASSKITVNGKPQDKGEFDLPAGKYVINLCN
jgi:alpha-L-rhamnosidase